MDDRIGGAFELWKGLSPSEAYMLGVENLGGTLFIPTRDNIIIKRREIDNIWKSTLDISIRSLLRWARCYLDLQEPIKPPHDIMWAVAGHLMKGGTQNPLLPSLLKNSVRYMEYAISDLKVHRWPVESQIMVLLRLGHLQTMLGTIPSDQNIGQMLGTLSEKLVEYGELFPVKEITGQSHMDLISVIEEGAGHFGRADIYPRILAELYACPERSKILEEKLILELYKELPEFKRVSFEMKDILGTGPDMDEIYLALAKDRQIKKKEIIPTVKGIQDRLSFWAIRRSIDYPHEFDLDMIETPEYFKPFVKNGRYMMMQGLTGKPTNELYITTERPSDQPLSYPEIFLFIIHEELGHRAHYLNSYSRPVDGVKITDVILGKSMESTFEGFANNRENDILGQLKDMSNRREELLSDEKRLVEHIERSYPLDELIGELEFLISKNRVMGLLAGIADIRINTGRQSIVDFMRWAHIITGIEERSIFMSAVNPAMTPGFNASQQLITSDLKQISQVMRNEGMSIKEFNTWSTRLGFPPWRFLKEKIMNYQDNNLFSK